MLLNNSLRLKDKQLIIITNKSIFLSESLASPLENRESIAVTAAREPEVRDKTDGKLFDFLRDIDYFRSHS
jgi:hypothetical protein